MRQSFGYWNTMASGPKLPFRIFALGALRIEGPDGPLTGDWLGQRPGELLRFLVCERDRIVPADAIGEAIWPHTGPAAPNTVRHFVHALRERLQPGRSARSHPSPVICRRGGYGLDPERVWVDADEFEREAQRGVSAVAGLREPDTQARAHLERAVGLYGGDFLSDELYGEWALGERERLRSAASDALRALVRIDGSSAEVRAELLERLAELEPFDDDVQRELISAWLRMGRRSRAVRQYESFRARLLHQFGTLPEFDLAQLVRALTRPRCA